MLVRAKTNFTTKMNFNTRKKEQFKWWFLPRIVDYRQKKKKLHL